MTTCKEFWNMVDKQRSEQHPVAPDLFGIDADIENVTNALYLIREGLEKEGYQSEDKFDSMIAYIFIKRLPYYLSALDLIISSMENIQEQISE